MSILREKYWIVHSRIADKNVVRNCITCKRFSAKPFGTKPTYLPLNRVKDAYTFEITGVDLAGHLSLQGGQKAWIVLFTCAVYRGIHLELVTSQSTECFIQALRRFVARRNRPATMYSDPGSNFKGTDNALSKLDWSKIRDVAFPDKIEWIINPPKAPWWGGWWERLIGMVKDLLKKVLGKVCVDYEEMTTILCDCEAVINKRPLTYVSGDTMDLEVLTPDMFLKDTRKTGVVDLDHIDSSFLNQKRSERQRIMNELRQRFRVEYLAQLPFRKGDAETRRIEIGEIVLIIDENKKKIHWPLARVIDICPGKSNKVRVAKVKTAKGIFVRLVKKLVPLEIRSDEELTTGIKEMIPLDIQPDGKSSTEMKSSD